MRQEVPGHLHGIDEELPVLDTHVDVGSEDEVAPGQVLKVVLEAQVPIHRGDG